MSDPLIKQLEDVLWPVENRPAETPLIRDSDGAVMGIDWEAVTQRIGGAKKVEPVLPEDLGAYHDRDGDLWVLDRNGAWHDFSSGERAEYERPFPRAYAPLTKLEPVAETAKRVFDRVRSGYFTDDPTYWGILDRFAAEFGVTS